MEVAGELGGDEFMWKTGRSVLGQWKKCPNTLPTAH